VTSVAIGRVGDRDVIVSGGNDRTVRIWDPTRGTDIAVQDTLHPVTAVAAASGLVIVVAGQAICAFDLS
jgi:WD40 repeat protein